MDNQTLRLRYTPTQQDYANVLRLFFWQRLSTRISMLLLAGAFGMVLYVILSKGSPPTLFELIWLLLPPLFVGYVYFVQPSRLASQAAQNEQLVAEATWDVNNEGVQVSSTFGTNLLAWHTLKKLVTTREYYLLLSSINKNAFRFIPRRAFTTPEEEKQFVALVNRNLAHKPVAGGDAA